MRIAAIAVAFAVLCCPPMASVFDRSALARASHVSDPEIFDAVVRAGRGVRLSSAVTRLVVRVPHKAGDVIAAVNFLIAGAHSAQEKQSLAESAALGFVRAQRILLATGRTAEAAAIAAAIDAEGDALLVEAANGVGSLPSLSTAGGVAPPPLAPDAFGGGAGGAEVSPINP